MLAYSTRRVQQGARLNSIVSSAEALYRLRYKQKHLLG